MCGRGNEVNAKRRRRRLYAIPAVIAQLSVYVHAHTCIAVALGNIESITSGVQIKIALPKYSKKSIGEISERPARTRPVKINRGVNCGRG